VKHRPKSVAFIAGIAVLQGILAFVFSDRAGVAPGWAAGGPGRKLYLALAVLSIVLGCAIFLRDNAARVLLLWLQSIVFLSAIVTVALLIRRGTVPNLFEVARVAWCFFLGAASLWTLSGTNSMEFFGDGHAGGHAPGPSHDGAHSAH